MRPLLVYTKWILVIQSGSELTSAILFIADKAAKSVSVIRGKGDHQASTIWVRANCESRCVLDLEELRPLENLTPHLQPCDLHICGVVLC